MVTLRCKPQFKAFLRLPELPAADDATADAAAATWKHKLALGYFRGANYYFAGEKEGETERWRETVERQGG